MTQHSLHCTSVQGSRHALSDLDHTVLSASGCVCHDLTWLDC